MTAWYGAALVYGTAKLPKLETLLNPPSKADKRRALLAMFERKARESEADSGGAD